MKNKNLFTALFVLLSLLKANAQYDFVMDTTINGQKYEKLSHQKSYIVYNTANYLNTIEYNGEYEPTVTLLYKEQLYTLVKKYIAPYVQDKLENVGLARDVFAITLYSDTDGVIKELGVTYPHIWEKIPMTSLAALERGILQSDLRLKFSGTAKARNLPWVRHVVLYNVADFKAMGRQLGITDDRIKLPENGGKLKETDDDFKILEIPDSL